MDFKENVILTKDEKEILSDIFNNFLFKCCEYIILDKTRSVDKNYLFTFVDKNNWSIRLRIKRSIDILPSLKFNKDYVFKINDINN